MQRKLRFIIFLALIFGVLLVLSSGVMAQDEKVATIAVFEEPATLDHRNYALNPSTFAVVWQIYEPLVYHDTRTDELIPGLSRIMGTTWTKTPTNLIFAKPTGMMVSHLQQTM